MSKQQYDLVIVGAGAGGLIAAGFAVQLVPKWPSSKRTVSAEIVPDWLCAQQSPVESAKIAHHVRTASQYGIMSQAPVTDMTKCTNISTRRFSKYTNPPHPKRCAKKEWTFTSAPRGSPTKNRLS